jgi:hypothetical protein
METLADVQESRGLIFASLVLDLHLIVSFALTPASSSFAPCLIRLRSALLFVLGIAEHTETES